MPPLPLTTQTLAARLNSLSESHKAALQLIQRLSKLDFQPGVNPSKSEDGDARLELTAEIHASLNQLDEELELLRQEVEEVVQSGVPTARRRDSVRETEKSRLAVLLARLTEDLKSSRVQFRKAQLTAKRNADRAKLKERELLFSGLQSGSSTPSPRHRKNANNSQRTENEVITGAASDVTAALRRTQQLMQSELQRSRFAQETLEQSTAALADLGDKYTDLSSLLSKSRNLVTTLLKSQKSDTWYLETTLYILLTTVIWLIFRRWLYGPITWFIIWPLKLLFRIAFAVVPTASVASSSSSVATSQEPRTSLIIKPSATDKPPKRPVNANQPPPYVRVGGGGKGYIHHQQDPSPQGSLSQTVGQMAERNQQGEERSEPVVRGDGTVLPDRASGRPANPKKKMWEEDVESAKHEREEAEKKQQESVGNTEGGKVGNVGPRLRKRDEL